MASVDYETSSDDHQSILVLVNQIGSDFQCSGFHKIFERLSRMNFIRVQDKQVPGWQRGILVSYKRNYSKESNEWGDFQSHRKVLGLLTVGKCSNDEELQELCKVHHKLQEDYKPTLYDSRCLVFGMHSFSKGETASNVETVEIKDIKLEVLDSSTPIGEELCTPDEPKEEKKDGTFKEFEGTTSLKLEDVQLESSSSESNNRSSTYDTSSPSEQSPGTEGTNVVASHSPSNDSSSPSDSPIRSKPLLVAPTKIEMVPIESNARGIPCIPYQSVDDCDKLELDIYEFLSSVFFVLEAKRLSYIGQDKQLKQDKYPLLKAPFENKDLVGVDLDTKNFKKKCFGRMKKHMGDISLQSGLPVEALTMYLSAVETLKSASDWLWLASAYEGQCSASITLLHPPQNRNISFQRNFSVPLPGRNTIPKARTSFSSTSPSRSLPSGLNPCDVKALGKNMLALNEITEKYRDAFDFYAKSKQALFIGIECCIKATRVHVLLEKYVVAAAFLQNVVFSNLQQSEEEKLQWFCTLAGLYTELGFHRKAAFFKWIAATRYGVLPLNNQNLSKPYHLIIETFDGYQLSLDPKDFSPGRVNGWPRVQMQVILELVSSAKRMKNQPLAVRHMSFLLYVLFQHLLPAERKDYCHQLEVLASKCEGGPVPLALETGLIVPPVNLLNLPLVKSFKLLSLTPHSRPVKLTSKKKKPVNKMGPFIFSPLMMNKEPATPSNKHDFKWVEGDVCEVALQIYNPLPFELKVTHMGLMADGVAFESFPACLSLPAESASQVNLLGTPRAAGELQLLGYTTHVLGVKSNCRLKDLPLIKEFSFLIDVIPCLPQLQLSTSLEKANTFSSLTDTSHVVMNVAVSLYSGQSRECSITLTNIGKESVEKVDISIQTKLGKELESQFFNWSSENLNMQLPILPGNSANFTLYINAIMGSIHLPETKTKEKLSRLTPASSPSNSPRYRPKDASSTETVLTKTVEAVIQLQYTGGKGMTLDFCRQCAISLNVEILPSLVITRWDVLPAEIATHCYLVLDVFNATVSEMELQYAANKCISIEAQDTCRIPVPVERCPFTRHFWGEIVDNQNHFSHLKALCKQHLVNLVDLRWELICLEISGKTSIAEVPWTSLMLDGILMSPIQWELKLCNRTFKFEEEFNYKIGDLITLTIMLKNMSENPLHDLCLRINGYQDYQNGHRTYRLETKRAIVGCERVTINKIDPEGVFEHVCGLVFFHAGFYKLDIQCSCPGLYLKQPKLNQNVINVEKNHSRQYHAGASGSHTWRCTPSVEITIHE